MQRPPEYRARAAHLRRQAETAHADLRGDYLKLADTYEDLALQIEQAYARQLAKATPAS